VLPAIVTAPSTKTQSFPLHNGALQIGSANISELQRFSATVDRFVATILSWSASLTTNVVPFLVVS
jgi:hypothetical protein